MKELIYSKKFPNEDEPDELPNAFSEVSERETIELTYVAVPGRDAIAKIFIGHAIKVSERYGYDIEIFSDSDSIEVSLSFDHQMTYSDFPHLIGMADDISIHSDINNREFTIILTFYTCEIYRDGKRALPDPEED